ncbi:hypothetical protein IRV08_22720, partial [Bacillus cereus]|nr:hypothetical protein [Bacillus cereus]
SYINDTTMLHLLKIRSNKVLYQELAENIETYYLHYNPENIQLSEEEKTLINNTEYHETARFYEMLHNEIAKFLRGEKYDPLKIICAIRVKVEKIVYDWLPTDIQKKEYIETHTTIKKLNYAIKQNIDIPEDFFLLQPLYNDALHMNDNENATRNKIQSICLKLDNFVIRRVVDRIQTTQGSNLILANA